MKKKSGFTLIELLAVIVILAIIAVIATPIILGIVDDAKKSAARSGALNFITAVQNQIALNDVNSTAYPALSLDGDVLLASQFASVKVSGTKPTAGSLTISSGMVTNGSLTVDSYSFTVTNGTIAQ